MRSSLLNYFLLITVFCLLGSVGIGQDKDKDKDKNETKEFCAKQDGWSNGNKYSSNDLRETTISKPGVVKVDSKNGRIEVIGENRNDVLVRACVRIWDDSQASADSKAKGVTISTSPTIVAQNTPEKNWSVAYEIHVPKSSNVDLNSGNGRITMNDVNGSVNFKTSNGRITLNNLSGDVKGGTSNGRVTVRLSGNSWQGSGMNVRTNNGRISLYLPANYAANVEAGTGNGRFSSDFEELSIKTEGKKRKYGANKVSASINGGGAPINLSTGNGRISIHSDKTSKLIP